MDGTAKGPRSRPTPARWPPSRFAAIRAQIDIKTKPAREQDPRVRGERPQAKAAGGLKGLKGQPTKKDKNKRKEAGSELANPAAKKQKTGKGDVCASASRSRARGCEEARAFGCAAPAAG